MCLAIPMQVIEVDGVNAQVALDGVERKIRVDFVPGIMIGEYVLVHAGIAIERVDEDEAIKTLELIKAITDEIYR